jgi:ATP-binding cassette, subfamily B, multidrug efflux pump
VVFAEGADYLSGHATRRHARAGAGVTAHRVGVSVELRRQMPRYAAGAVLIGAYQFAQYWFDTRLRLAVTHLVAAEQRAALVLGVELVAVALVAMGLRVLSRLAVFNAGRLAEYELRRALLGHLHRLGPAFTQQLGTGEITSRAINDLTQIRLLLGFGVLNLINTAFGLVSALAVTLGISVKLTLASLAALPLLLPVTWQFSRHTFRRTRETQTHLGRLASVVQTSIAGVRVVRALGLEPSETERFAAVNQDYLVSSLALARLRGLLGPVLQIVSGLGLLISFWYGGSLLLRGELEPGGFLAFFRALIRLTWPLVALGFLVSMVQRGRAAYSRIADLYAVRPPIEDGLLALPEPAEGALDVRGLDFAYGPNTVLAGVGFTLPARSSLAVVGRTGSGKSTLAQLVARLLPTPRGAVHVDGVDVCDLPVSVVRRTIGYAEQGAFLFSTTVAHNIGFTFDEPDTPEARQRIEGAARDAQILAELGQLPDGLDTLVGERGVQLSGGQRQRVALARALVQPKPVLLLDDPLSAVDASTAEALLSRLELERGRRSLLLITHRVAAAARCDRILVLDRGRVVEEGTHQELLDRRGLYAEFAREQALEEHLRELGASAGPA